MKTKLWRRTTLCAFSFLAISMFLWVGDAYANLSLDKVIINFTPDDRPVQNITVTNSGTKTLKIKTSVVHVINPGQENITEEETKTLSTAPKLFELSPGEKRLVRLVLRKFPNDLEEIYRVRFTPDKADRSEEKEAGGKSVKVDIVTAMGALILVSPKSPHPDFTFTRSADGITFQNNGNVTAHLQRGEFCSDNDPAICTPLPGKRVYPGASWVMKLPESLRSHKFTQTLLMNENYTTLTFPAP